MVRDGVPTVRGEEPVGHLESINSGTPLTTNGLGDVKDDVKECMKILIIRVSAIGDVVHTLPSLFLLKKLLPECTISWVVQKKAADLLVGQPFLGHVWVLPDHYLSPGNLATTANIIRDMRRHRWDAIIDFQGLLKTSLLIFLLRGKKFGFSAAHARSGFTTLFTHRRHTPDYKNIVQKNLSLASYVASVLTPYRSCPTVLSLAQYFIFEVPQKKQCAVETWLCDVGVHDKKIIVLSPNTTWDEKHWPVEHWITLIQLGANDPHFSRACAFVLAGKDHGQAALAVYQGCLERGITLITVPGWDLATLAHCLKQASLVVAPDTGVLHLADFLGTQTIALFGPTNKDVHGPFWQARNVRNAYQIGSACCKDGCAKKQKTVFCRCGMYTLKPEELFARIDACLGIPGGKV
jgi:lipopolysaccharide heptosyltransferase I